MQSETLHGWLPPASRLQQTKLLFGTRKAVASCDSDIELCWSCASIIFYQWRSPYAWGLYQEVQSCLLLRGSHLVRGGPQRSTDVHVYKLLTATCMFICHIVHHEKIFSLNSHGDIFAYISSLVFLICISCRTINKNIFVYLHVQLSSSWQAEFVNQQCANICYTHCLHKSWVLITVFPCALF